MKKTIQSLTVLWVLGNLLGCGVMKLAEDTRNFTEDLTKKMDITNKRIEETNIAVEATNKKMEVTNAAIHTQTLAVALNSLLANENNEVLTPPTDAIPFAEKFAEEATPHELIQTFHLLYVSVVRGFQAEINGDKKVKRRQIRLTAASALAALASEEKANEIFQKQIIERGEYLDSAYVFAFCRYTFTRDILFQPLLEADPESPNYRTPTLLLLKEAKKRYLTLQGLATTGYVQKLKIFIPEFVEDKETKSYLPFEDKLKPAEYKRLGRLGLKKFNDPNEPAMQSEEALELMKIFQTSDDGSQE